MLIFTPCLPRPLPASSPPSPGSPTRCCWRTPGLSSCTSRRCSSPSSTTCARSRSATCTCASAAPACSTTRCANWATARAPPGGIKAMRLCAETAGTRERLQDGSLTLSAAAQLQNTFELQQRAATAAADRGSASAAPELLPGGTGTTPEAGALGAEAAAPVRPVPALDAAQRQELVAQASGKSTREVKQLLAGVAPEAAPPAERMRALGEGRWELKVVVDAACQRGIEQLRALLSHVDPHLTVGQLVERLVQDGLQRYDPGRPRRGRAGERREASAGQTPEPQAQEGPAGGATSLAKRGAQEQPAVRRPRRARAPLAALPRPRARAPVAAPRRRLRCPQSNPRGPSAATRSTAAAARRRQRGPQRNSRAGLAAPATRRRQRCPRRRRGTRLAAALRRVPSHRRLHPTQSHWRRSRRPIVGPTPPHQRHG